MKSLRIIILLLLLILSLTMISLTADKPFYEGKVIEMIVPHGVGGGFDMYARLIQPFLEKYLPGSTVVIVNTTGAGGEIGRNQAFIAKPDGYTICLTAGDDMVYNSLAENEAVRYDINEWTYLARISAEASVLTVPAKSELNSIEDIKNANKTLSFACSGVGDADYFGLGVAAHVFDFDILPVTGYAGSKEASMAAIRADVDLWQASLGSVLPVIQNNDVKPIMVLGLNRVSELPDVPTAIELIKNEEMLKLMKAICNINEVRRLIVAPPGLSADKTEIFREAIDKSLNDPDLIAISEQTGRPIVYLKGEMVGQLVKETMEVGELLKPILDETLKLAQ